MESSSQKLTKKIAAILTLLQLSDESIATMATNFFDSILKQLHQPHDVEKIARRILQIYRGMGSFNDLILYKEGKLLEAEHEKFDKLSDELFALCLEIISIK